MSSVSYHFADFAACVRERYIAFFFSLYLFPYFIKIFSVSHAHKPQSPQFFLGVGKWNRRARNRSFDPVRAKRSVLDGSGEASAARRAKRPVRSVRACRLFRSFRLRNLTMAVMLGD